MMKKISMLSGLLLGLAGCGNTQSGSDDSFDLDGSSSGPPCIEARSSSIGRSEDTDLGFSVQQMLDAIPDAVQFEAEWSEDDLGLASETPTAVQLENIRLDPDSGELIETEDNPEDGQDYSDVCSAYVQVDGEITLHMDGVLEPLTLPVSFRGFESWDRTSFAPLMPVLDVDVALEAQYRAAVMEKLSVEGPCGDAQYDGAYLIASTAPGAGISLGVTSLHCLDDPEGALFRSGGIVAGSVVEITGMVE